MYTGSRSSKIKDIPFLLILYCNCSHFGWRMKKIFLFLLIFFVTAAIFDGEWSYHYQDITFNGDLPKNPTL